MILKDLHVHTYFSDGHDSPEEMAEKAYSMGLKTLGFSDHSYTWFDESYCMPERRYDEYISCINSLKKAYKGKMEIKLGIELDAFSDLSHFEREKFDYIIASCHYLYKDGDYFALDESPKDTLKYCKKYFGGDMIKMTAEYYKTFSDFIVNIKPDIIGHFDYISRDNAFYNLFDESDPRYVRAWKFAAKKALSAGGVFEINVGGLSRNVRSNPYPSCDIVEYLKERGAEFILSSDAHEKENICYNFEKFKDYA